MLGFTRSSALCVVVLRIIEWCELGKMDLYAVFIPSIGNF